MAEADPNLPRLYNVHEAKTQLSRLLDRAHAGEEIVIAKAGKPYARLVPAQRIAQLARRQPGALKHLGPLPDDLLESAMTEADLDAWEAKLSSS